jgi:hypothetical protein
MIALFGLDRGAIAFYKTQIGTAIAFYKNTRGTAIALINFIVCANGF